MDAELDLASANGLVAVHDAVRNAAPDQAQFAESDEGDEFENESNDESGDTTASPFPPHLKEISSLAAWNVSTHKPGCGVAALCHPSTTQFWQSDGPQPHYLNIHFFKMVSIAYMRVFLDFEQDESYTPTKLQFLAGTGHHDLQDVCTMAFKEPKGWLEVDLSNAGGPNPFEDGDFDDEDLESKRPKKRTRQPGHGPTLRCRLVQLRILENHQNGKDTHLRGLQLFAIDESAVRVRRRRKVSVNNPQSMELSTDEGGASLAQNEANTNVAAPRRQNGLVKKGKLPQWRPGASSPFAHDADSPSSSAQPTIEEPPAQQSSRPSGGQNPGRKQRKTIPMVGLREPAWMGEPSLR